MANDWIKMRMDLQTHPKIVRILSATKSDKFRVIGGLHSVWCVFDTHSEDGTLKGYTLQTMDHIIGWPGFSAAVSSVGWLIETPEGLVMPDFEEHNGASAKRRSEDTKRKRKIRMSAKCPQSVRKVSEESADEKTTREEKRREEYITTTTNVREENLVDPHFKQEEPHRQSIDENHPVWDWMPNEIVINQIKQFRIPVEFASEQLSEFKVYRSGQKENFTNYDSKYLSSVLTSWKRIGHKWQPNPIFQEAQAHEATQSGTRKTSSTKLSNVERYLLSDSIRLRELQESIEQLEAQGGNDETLGVANG